MWLSRLDLPIPLLYVSVGTMNMVPFHMWLWSFNLKRAHRKEEKDWLSSICDFHERVMTSVKERSMMFEKDVWPRGHILNGMLLHHPKFHNWYWHVISRKFGWGMDKPLTSGHISNLVKIAHQRVSLYDSMSYFALCVSLSTQKCDSSQSECSVVPTRRSVGAVLQKCINFRCKNCWNPTFVCNPVSSKRPNFKKKKLILKAHYCAAAIPLSLRFSLNPNVHSPFLLFL